MHIIEKPTGELIPYANNPRQNEDAVRYVAASIKEFGFKVPIVIDSGGVIVAGHTRLLAAKSLGLATVPCIVADDLSPEQIKAFRLADNKVSEAATWDIEKLNIELDELKIDFDMSDFGFAPETLAAPELDTSAGDSDNEPSDTDKGEETESEPEEKRRLLNLEIANFLGVGAYGIPELTPEEYKPMDFIPFSDAASFTGDAPNTGIHFFLDDYRFMRVWNNPLQQLSVLQRFGCLLTPDFSLFLNTPKAIQIFNHYRKHWCGALWQAVGLKVIPTICWSDQDSFAWCFDGEPTGGAVAVSSVGVMAQDETKAAFMAGYEEMKKRLEPATILHYGKPIDDIADEVVELEAFQAKFDRMRAEKKAGA